MNKKIWGIAGPAAMAMGLALSACGGGNADRLDVCYEEYDYLSVACKTEGDSLAADSALMTWRCEAEGVLPLKIGKLDIKQLRDTLMALGAVDLDGSKAVAKLPAGYKAAPDTHPDSVESVVANNLSVVLVNPRVMVWRCYHYAYPAGAAHGTYSDTYINYSTEGDGKVLSLADIFRKGAESQLLEMVRATRRARRLARRALRGEIACEFPGDRRGCGLYLRALRSSALQLRGDRGGTQCLCLGSFADRLG